MLGAKKSKNRLKRVSSRLTPVIPELFRTLIRMATITRQYVEALGKTGEGIKHIEDVDMSCKNSFTNKWGTFCFIYLLKPFIMPITDE